LVEVEVAVPKLWKGEEEEAEGEIGVKVEFE
jgi:hypothetical protein